MARQRHDLYPTPENVAWVVTEAIHKLYPNKTCIVEPSAGNGVFVRHARAYWPSAKIYAVEINEEHMAPLLAAGADEVYIEPFESWISRYNWDFFNSIFLGNPPFSLAQEHIGLMLDYALHGTPLAFLLKMNFLCSRKRAESFWPRGQLRYIIPFDTRPSFVKGEKADNDTNEYALMVWEVGYEGDAVIKFPHITWKHLVAQSHSARASTQGQALAGTSED